MYRYSAEERVIFLVLYGKKYLPKIFFTFLFTHALCILIYIYNIYLRLEGMRKKVVVLQGEKVIFETQKFTPNPQLIYAKPPIDLRQTPN
jgi:hypothetical protein